MNAEEIRMSRVSSANRTSSPPGGVAVYVRREARRTELKANKVGSCSSRSPLPPGTSSAREIALRQHIFKPA